MQINKIGAGDIPHAFNVIIEIPAHSTPVKYEVDKASGGLMVDRFLGTSMCYPVNYGYVPQTLSDDGDPADVLVITPLPLIHGAIIKCRPIGVLKMTDESGEDAKILALPIAKLTPIYNSIKSYQDLPQAQLKAISHFFEHYKDLEEGKWVKLDGWHDVAAAEAELKNSVAHFAREEAAL